MNLLTETLTLSAKVTPDSKLVLEVPAAFKGKTVRVKCTLEEEEAAPLRQKDWETFTNEVYGSIQDENFEAPPRSKLRPPPSFEP